MCPICKQDFTWENYNNGDVIERYNLAWHKACAIRALESLGSGEIQSPQIATSHQRVIEFQNRADTLQLVQMTKDSLMVVIVGASLMHLTMELAEELWPILKRFAETGELTK